MYSYRELEKHLAGCITLVTLELPGHGRRMREPLLTEITEMTHDLFHQLTPDLNPPYAFYGHSMGALLGYLLCVQMRHAGMTMPLHLFVSGRQSPSVPSKERDWHRLPSDEFLQCVMAYGGIPEPVAKEQELLDLFLPVLKADFQALSAYAYTARMTLDLPMTVMIGSDDDIAYDDARQWQALTQRDIIINQFSGKHFFIFKHLPAIGRLISQTLRDAIEVDW